MQAAVTSAPAPPYSSGTVMPSKPMSPSLRKSAWLNLLSQIFYTCSRRILWRDTTLARYSVLFTPLARYSVLFTPE
jgi:hypothetical protein